MISEAAVSIPIRYFSAKQAADYLGLSIYSLYRYVERREIPFIPLYPSGTKAKPGSRASVRFDREALDRWMRKQMVRPVGEVVDSKSMKV